MKKISKFKTKNVEREFWEEHDSTEYLDWVKGKRTKFPNLIPSTKTISLRLLQTMLDELKLLAKKRDLPYQSLLKLFLSEKIEEEFHKYAPKRYIA